MSNLNSYIQSQYDGDDNWFMNEVNQSNHINRISSVISNKNYLSGRHKVLNRQDSVYKGKVFTTRKTVIQYAKTVLRFHTAYLLGKQVQLCTDDADTLRVASDIYRRGSYSTVDYQVLDHVQKYGDAFEYVYVNENGEIRSKVLDNACCYPVYDDMGNYVSFIESWTDAYSNAAHWTVYYPTYVERWSNASGDALLDSVAPSFGLPIHYHNFSDEDEHFGQSLLDDIKPILDDLEDILSKMGDAIYTNTLSVMPVATGQYIDSSIPADAVGYVMNLDHGDFKYMNATMDYQTIKLYLDNLKQMLNDVSCVPSVLGASTNIANISSVSMQILLMMANVYAEENKKWLNIGFRERFKIFQRILLIKGVKFFTDIDVVYNVGMPIASSEMIANFKALQEMGAISKQTIMEKSEYVTDVDVEMQRLASEEGQEIVGTV